MKLTEKELSRGWQEATLTADHGSQCPDNETLARLARSELSQDEKHAVVDHLVTCSGCAATVQLLSSLTGWAQQAAAPGTQPATVRLFRTLATRRGRVLAAAATVIVAASLSLLWQGRSGSPEPEMQRGPRQEAILLSCTPPHEAVLEEPPQQLAFSLSQPTQHRFVVTLYDANLAPLWQSEESTATNVTLPTALQQRLVAGKPYYWRVKEIPPVAERTWPLLRFELSADKTHE